MRIVSLNPTATQSLVLLGKADFLVGCTSFCRKYYSGKAQTVGTAINFSVENLVELSPDLVIASGLSPEKKCRLLTKSGLKTLRLSPPKNYLEIREQFLLLAKEVLAEKEAAHIINICDQKVKNLTKSDTAKTVFFQVGAAPIYTVPAENYLNDLIVRSGGINIGREFKSGLISREAIITENPDVIIVAGMGSLKGMEEVEKWQKLSILKAVRNNKVFYLNTQDQACSPQPVAFCESLSEMVQLLAN